MTDHVKFIFRSGTVTTQELATTGVTFIKVEDGSGFTASDNVLCDIGAKTEVVTLDSTARCYDWYDRSDPDDNLSKLRASFTKTHTTDMIMRHSSTDNDLMVASEY